MAPKNQLGFASAMLHICIEFWKAFMQKIKNIIFDYGNVIFEINFKMAQSAFVELGISDVESFFAHKGHHRLFDDFETGSISADMFREGIREAAGNSTLSAQLIDDAWNSLLIGIPPANHEVLLEVRDRYRSFLLSNNNEIHYQWIVEYLKRHFHLDSYEAHFEKAYFSQQMRLRKPHKEIFEQVLLENQLLPEETLFIDDSPQHIDGARLAGLNTLLMDQPPQKLREFLITQRIL